MSDVLTPEKTGRGWIMDVPPEMAAAMGVGEGSVIVLYPREGGMATKSCHRSHPTCRLPF